EMLSDFDAVRSQEAVQLTTRFSVELQDHLDEAAATVVAELVAKVGRDFVGSLVLAVTRPVALAFENAGLSNAARESWSQGEVRQQRQRQEPFCQLRRFHLCRLRHLRLSICAHTVGRTPFCRGCAK